MAGRHKRRKRKVDVDKLSVEQAEKLSKQIGQEVAKIMDEANSKCNKLLNIYGLQTSIGYEIVEMDKKSK